MITLRHVPKVTQVGSCGAQIGPRTVFSIAVRCSLSTTLLHVLCEASAFVVATWMMFIHRSKFVIIISTWVLFNSMALLIIFGKIWLSSIIPIHIFHSSSYSHTFIFSLSYPHILSYTLAPNLSYSYNHTPSLTYTHIFLNSKP